MASEAETAGRGNLIGWLAAVSAGYSRNDYIAVPGVLQRTVEARPIPSGP